MSFSTEVKNELLRKIPGSDCCRFAECFAIIYFCAKISKKHENEGDFLAALEPSLAEKCFTLSEKSFNIDRVRSIPIEKVVLEKTCCKRAFLSGAFLTSGSMSDPKKGCHLELAAQDAKRADLLIRLFKESEIEAKRADRKNGFGVYIKDGDAIARILALIDAPKAMMEFENSRIEKEIRNSINRKVNCEAANIGKTVAASSAQIDDIKRLKESGHFEALPETLKEIARLRLKWPEATLEELGAKASPPIGKSGVNHRLRRLIELAQKEAANSKLK